MKVSCDARDCKSNKAGVCTLSSISINDCCECEYYDESPYLDDTVEDEDDEEED